MKKMIATIGILFVLVTTLCGCDTTTTYKEPTVYNNEYFEETLSYDQYGNITQRIITNKTTEVSYIYTYYYVRDNGIFLLSRTEIATIDETGAITITANE
jgi:hypothetical protein